MLPAAAERAGGAGDQRVSPRGASRTRKPRGPIALGGSIDDLPMGTSIASRMATARIVRAGIGPTSQASDVGGGTGAHVELHRAHGRRAMPAVQYTRAMKRARAAAAVLGLIVAGASGVRATTYLPATFEEIVAEAVTIAYGRVVAVRPGWTDDRATIESLVVLQVVRPLKGSPGPTVSFRVPGGQVGDRTVVVPGAPGFREGELVVIFLKGQVPAIPRPVGLAQGVFRVVADPQRGEAVVVPPPLVARGARGTVVRGDPARRPLPLDAFAAEVRRLVEGGR